MISTSINVTAGEAHINATAVEAAKKWYSMAASFKRMRELCRFPIGGVFPVLANFHSRIGKKCSCNDPLFIVLADYCLPSQFCYLNGSG